MGERNDLHTDTDQDDTPTHDYPNDLEADKEAVAALPQSQSNPLELFRKCFAGLSSAHEDQGLYEFAGNYVNSIFERRGYSRMGFPSGAEENIASSAVAKVFRWGKNNHIKGPDAGRILISVFYRSVAQKIEDERKKLESYKLYKAIEYILTRPPFVQTSEITGTSSLPDLFSHQTTNTPEPLALSPIQLERLAYQAGAELPLERGAKLPDKKVLTDWIARLFQNFGAIHLSISDVCYVVHHCIYVEKRSEESIDNPYSTALNKASIKKDASDIALDLVLVAKQIAEYMVPQHRKILAMKGQGYTFDQIAGELGWKSPDSARLEYILVLKSIDAVPDLTEEDKYDVVAWLQKHLA